LNKGFLRFAVLGIVVKKYPVHGYRIMELIEEKMGFKPSPGSIYPVLNKLVSDGLIYSETSGKRKLYYPTEKGKKIHEELESQRAELVNSHRKFAESLARLVGVKSKDIFPENFSSIPGIVKRHIGKVMLKLHKTNWKKGSHIDELISELNTLIEILTNLKAEVEKENEGN